MKSVSQDLNPATCIHVSFSLHPLTNDDMFGLLSFARAEAVPFHLHLNIAHNAYSDSDRRQFWHWT